MMEFNRFQYGMPTKIVFGIDTFNEVGEHAARLGTKALIVTGRSAMKKLGFTDRLNKLLEDQGLGYQLFDAVPSNPGVKTIDAGVELCRKTGCDVVVALGGGSAIDAAKAIACSAGLGIPMADLLKNPVEKPGLPVVAIPTTSGTGAEVTHISVLTIEEDNHKIGFRTSYTYPTVAVVDPKLCLSMPPYITAFTGVDALTHAIEAYTSRTASPAADVWAIRAIELAGKYLRTAVEDGKNLNARAGMALASTMAGVAISQAGTGAAHGIAMTVGGILGCDHGAIVGLSLPAVIRFNGPVQRDKLAHVAALLGVDTSGMTPEEAVEAAATAVEQLLRDLKLPMTIRELGGDPSLLDRFMEDTKKQGVWRNNPREASFSDMEELFRAVM